MDLSRQKILLHNFKNIKFIFFFTSTQEHQGWTSFIDSSILFLCQNRTFEKKNEMLNRYGDHIYHNLDHIFRNGSLNLHIHVHVSCSHFFSKLTMKNITSVFAKIKKSIMFWTVHLDFFLHVNASQSHSTAAGRKSGISVRTCSRDVIIGPHRPNIPISQSHYSPIRHKTCFLAMFDRLPSTIIVDGKTILM